MLAIQNDIKYNLVDGSSRSQYDSTKPGIQVITYHDFLVINYELSHFKMLQQMVMKKIQE